jgi:tetratricopeptide (TPR) repeat protein
MTMSSPNIETAVHKNLRGVQHMEAYRFAEAISEFSGALNAVKTILSELDATNGDIMEGTSSSFGIHNGNRSQKLVFEFAEDDEMDQDQQQQEGLPFIFQSPIVASFSCSASPQEQDQLESLVKFSSSILFNLALSYHLGAINVAPNLKMKMLLQKALTFYKLAYTMMQDTRNNGVMETLAITNNLGHVQLTVGDVDKAKQCYEHLLSTIMFVTDSGDPSVVQNFEGFFHSVQTIVLPSRPTARAA